MFAIGRRSKRSVRSLPLGIAAVALSLAAGCGVAPAVAQARRGDLGALSAALDDQARRGALDDGTLREVSRAMLEHDLARFGGERDARRVGSLALCAKPLASPLRRLARDGEPEVASAAAIVLLDAEVVDRDEFTGRHRDDTHPRWRAAAARGLVDADTAALRATRTLDDDRDVRRMATLAAIDAGTDGDRTLLLDVARRDPDVVVRVTAIRGLGTLAAREDEAAASRRADLADRLADLWSAGDDVIRGAVARAWATPPLFGNGGRGHLESTAGQVSGDVAVETASALWSGGGDGAALLARLANDPEPPVRRHALRLLDPAIDAHREALAAALHTGDAGDDDPEARLIAAERIAGYSPPLAKALGPSFEGLARDARAALVALANGESKVATEAAIALASLGDGAVVAKLVKELDLPTPLRGRIVAVLVGSGHGAEVRKLLSSADLDVRDAAACAVLAAPRPGR
jgi:hypothetical protein